MTGFQPFKLDTKGPKWLEIKVLDALHFLGGQLVGGTFHRLLA